MSTSPPDRRGEAGYNLVVLIVAVTILNILLAASLPLWSTAIRREKEEELIFRGLQYAEALRVFQNRYQHFPTRLEELVESNQRCIRQLWKDPMTEDGKWGLIFQGQGQPLPTHPPKDEEDPTPEEDDGPGPRKGEEVAVGPIVGVYSKSGKESIMTFFGKERYDEWRFTVDILLQQQPKNEGGAGVPPLGGGIVLSTKWLGRPLPYLDQFSQIPGGVQGLNGNLPGATGQKPKKPGSGTSNKP